MTPAAVPAVGARFDRFEVVGQLGAGAMGVVVLARDVDLGRPVAIKFITRRGAADEAGNLRLLREAQAVARLQHPNVVAVHEVGKLGDQIFVVMEYVDGGTLRQWCAAQPRTWQSIVDVYVQAALGLEAAHAAGLVHRDFKPDNALIGGDGRVRVSDFGLVAASVGEPAAFDDPQQEVTLTRTGALLGTPAYMAPEQFAGADVGPAADQFALCVALFEALYGVRPFAGANFTEILCAIESGTLRAQTRADVPSPIHGAVVRGLAIQPGYRHPSMRVLADALRWRPLVAAPQRSRAPVVAVVAVAVTMTLAAATAVWWQIRDPVSPPLALVTPPPDAPPLSSACGVAAAVDGVWNSKVIQGLDAAFVRSGSPFAVDAASRTRAALDEHATGLRSTSDTICKVPPADAMLLRRAEACLANGLDALVGTVETLTHDTTAAMVETSLGAVGGFPRPSRCADPVMLAADGAPPSRPPAELAALRRSVWGVYLLLQAGENDRAAAILTLAQPGIASLDEASLDALEAYVRAQLAAARRDPVGCEGALREALGHARAASDSTLESVILANLLDNAVTGLGRREGAEAIAGQLQALLPRVAGDSRWYVHAALGRLAVAQSRLPEAEIETNAALDALTREAQPRSLAVAAVHMARAHLRMFMARPDDALADAERARVEFERAAGKASTVHADALMHLALLLAQRGDRVTARARLAQAREVLDRASPRAQQQLPGTLIQFAAIERGAQAYDEAARLLDDALELAGRRGDAELNARISIDIAVVEFFRARYDAATVAIERAVEIADRFPQSPQIDRLGLVQIRASVAYARGEFVEAVALQNQRLGLTEARWGSSTGPVAVALVDLGELHVLTGDCTAALTEFDRAERIRESLEFVPDMDLARMLAGRALCHARELDADAAREQVRKIAALPELAVPAALMAPRLAMIDAELANSDGDNAGARAAADRASAAYLAMGSAWVSQRRDVETWKAENLEEEPEAGAARP